MNHRTKPNLKIVKTFAETPGFFVVGPILTTSGYLNPIYPESRRTFSYPKKLQTILGEVKKFIKKKKIKFDLVCGAATCGIMLSSPLALQLKKQQIYVREKTKKGGMGLAVEGAYKKGQRVILIDDATAGGKHKISFIKNLRKVGLEVAWVIVSVARNKYSKKDNLWAKKMKVKYQAFCDLNDIRQYALKHKIISKEASQIMNWYANDPTNWHKDKNKWQFFRKYKKMKNR